MEPPILEPVVYEFPIWVQYVEKLGAPIIAIVALIVTGYFAWRQWRTAHEQRKIAQQRVVLDLFERRMEVVDRVREVIAKIMAKGKTEDRDMYDFLVARDRVAMLFGEDVQNYLRELYKKMTDHATDCGMENLVNGDEHTELVKRKGKKFRDMIKFYDEFPKLVAPYVQMHTKVP